MSILFIYLFFYFFFLFIFFYFFFSDKETSKPTKQTGNSSHKVLPTLRRLFGSCIAKGEATIKADTKEVKKDGGEAAKVTDINPLKKYAPVSAPGWEVNIIYTKNVKRVPRRSYSDGDMVSLIDNMDCDTEVELKDKKTSVFKRISMKPVRALRSLVRRVPRTRELLSEINRKF